MIEIRDLVKRYGPRVALHGVSLSVREGEVFGLLGPNGAGKTTLVSILATLLPPDEGQVTVGGHDLVRQPGRVKPLVGFVPQDLALYPTLSARDNLAFFGRIYGLRGRALQERVAAVLDVVGLQERAGDPVRTFSGGMKRRLNIAVGLIHRPRVLLLDEPTVGVDPQSRHFILEHLQRLKAEGMTVLYTTHYMEEAQRLCDRVAIVDEGRVVAMGTPGELVRLLGGGVLYVGVAAGETERLLPLVRTLRGVQAVSVQDSRLKVQTYDARRALREVVELCNAYGVPILSLEVLEPNLESVFLHLTGKRLRD
ncbi:MAG: ATP-binding cassette domain-containing protein [bacterium]